MKTTNKPRHQIISECSDKLKTLFVKCGLHPLEANAYGGYASVYFATQAEAQKALRYFSMAGYENPRIMESYNEKGELKAFVARAKPCQI